MRWLPEKKKAAAARPSMAAPSASTARWAKAPLSPWRLAPLVLWALVLAGAAGGVLALGRDGGASASATTPGQTVSSAGPAGWAQLYVRAFLAAGEANEGQLEAFFPSAPPLLDVRADSLRAAWTLTMGATPVAPGYWTVVVAAGVEGNSAQGSAPSAPGTTRWPSSTRAAGTPPPSSRARSRPRPGRRPRRSPSKNRRGSRARRLSLGRSASSSKRSWPARATSTGTKPRA